MLNTLAAASKLTTLHISRGARKWGTIAAFLMPVLFAAAARMFPQHIVLGSYGAFITSVYTSLIVPFIGIFWGSSLLGDELQGKTLVYLWTRPTSRILLFLLKYVVMVIWFAVLVTLSLLAVFTIFHYEQGLAHIRENSMMLLWDIRALVLGALAYAALAYLLSKN